MPGNTTNALVDICPSVAECFALSWSSTTGYIVIGTNNSGATWEVEAYLSGLSNIDGITCPSTTECFTYGSGAESVGAVIYEYS